MSRLGSLARALGLALAALLAFLVAGVALTYAAGAVRVEVENKHHPAENVRVVIPAVALRAGLAFLPDEVGPRLPPEARRVLPALALASRELARQPDAVLVEIRNPRERVRISSQKGNLLVDVENAGERVHVSVPLETLARVTEELARRCELNYRAAAD